mmetsp:Transcript_40609/g.60216  ORF Transcript_40609/g.60216 Transcript_40609/m.60216 type:complete len:210 (-) Transcript_40609:26-655(-)
MPQLRQALSRKHPTVCKDPNATTRKRCEEPCPVQPTLRRFCLSFRQVRPEKQPHSQANGPIHQSRSQNHLARRPPLLCPYFWNQIMQTVLQNEDRNPCLNSSANTRSKLSTSATKSTALAVTNRDSIGLSNAICTVLMSALRTKTDPAQRHLQTHPNSTSSTSTKPDKRNRTTRRTSSAQRTSWKREHKATLPAPESWIRQLPFKLSPI